jgi:CBS domain containing-hemolysin-like protein
LLAGLVLLAGFFNSSEAALFSLTPADRGRASSTVRELLDEPRRLLVTILLSNMLVNILYFSFAARLLPPGGGWTEVLVGLGVLIVLVVFGDILPKVVALRARAQVAAINAPFLVAVVFLFRPFSRPVLRFLELLHRGPLNWIPPERGITAEVLAHVLERGAQEGALHEREADLLSGIIQLDEIRVREIMTPRVDVLFLDLSGEDRERVLRAALEKRASWLPVIDGEPDQVVGLVHLRHLVAEPDRPIRQLVMPVKFVPEVASVLATLQSLREDRTSEAVVVDEWGGTAGIVTVENVFEEIVGDLRAEGETHSPAVVPLGKARYRVSGSLSIREWNEAFGLRVVPTEFETVGGFVTALLGRIPRAGDTVRVEELEMEVHEVRKRRVLTVDIGLLEPSGAGRG